MTEKRFESRQSINKTGYVVIDNEKQYTFPVMSKDDCYMFCKVLNALHEENKQLRKLLDIGRTNAKSILDVLNEQEQELNNLYDENQDLKQGMKRLYNYFEDYLEDEMSANSFSEMWDVVKDGGYK